MKKLFVKFLLLFFIGITFVGCASDEYKAYACNSEQRKEMSQFLKESIKSANNMSDEEMEDVIRELENVAIKTHCTQTKIWANTCSIDYEKSKIEEGRTYHWALGFCR